MDDIKTETTLTCPKCGKEQTVTMPTNACQHFYKCIHCGEMLKPKEGDCCVFCSYADSKCPPKQEEALAK
ncbi:MAG: GDCCVxC domain-containing (seleno)protein [Candidatus Curtissbacteria bacterium]|nr:GDCCVxC domain-containing (seleno)protein [Candidatus Curtissbacteria bacterium]